MNSGRQVGDPFLCLRQGWSSEVFLGSIGWFLLPSPSSVASAGYSTPGPLCGVHLSGGDKDFCWCLHLGWFPGDRCCARTPDIALPLIPQGYASAFWWDHLFSATDTSRRKRVISSKIRSVSGSNGYSSPSSMLSVNLTLNNLLIGSTCSNSYSKC